MPHHLGILGIALNVTACSFDCWGFNAIKLSYTDLNLAKMHVCFKKYNEFKETDFFNIAPAGEDKKLICGYDRNVHPEHNFPSRLH